MNHFLAFTPVLASFDWATLIGGAANVASGGVLGLFGSVFSGIAGYFNSKVQFAHDEKMAQLNIDASKAASAAQLAQTTEAAAGNAFTSSQQSTIGAIASGILTFCRELITFGLMFEALRIYETATGADKSSYGQQIMFLSGVAIQWHFGQRAATRISENLIAQRQLNT